MLHRVLNSKRSTRSSGSGRDESRPLAHRNLDTLLPAACTGTDGTKACDSRTRIRNAGHLVGAAKKLKRLDQMTLKAQLASSKSRVVSIRFPEADLASQKGLSYQTY